MYASKHAVFAGPGRLPKELRDLLLERQGAPQSDLLVQPARLLSFFASAAEAERVASQLQRLKIAAVVAGPEQPPAEAAWLEVVDLELQPEQILAHAAHQEQRTFTPAELKSMTVLDWRPDDETVDRAVLLRVRDFHRPLYLRAQHLRPRAPHEGLRLVTALIERCQQGLPPEAPSRQKKLGPETVGAPTLTGDLLPLALAFVDLVEAPRSHGAPNLAPLEVPPSASALATSSSQPRQATLWASAAVLSSPVTLALLSLGLMQGRLLPVLTGTALALWSTRRFLWSRWLRRHLTARDRAAGLEPTWWDPALELGVSALSLGLLKDPFFAPVALPLGGLFAALFAASALTVHRSPKSTPESP